MFGRIDNTFHVHIGISEGLPKLLRAVTKLMFKIFQQFPARWIPHTGSRLVKSGSRYASSIPSSVATTSSLPELPVRLPQSFAYELLFIPHLITSWRPNESDVHSTTHFGKLAFSDKNPNRWSLCRLLLLALKYFNTVESFETRVRYKRHSRLIVHEASLSAWGRRLPPIQFLTRQKLWIMRQQSLHSFD